MKQTIRKNITDIPYSLHDAEVNKMTVEGKKLTLGFKNGYVQNAEPYDDVKGTVVFDGIDWDCSFACVYKCKEFTLENTGAIEGEKQMLKDFAENYAGAVLRSWMRPLAITRRSWKDISIVEMTPMSAVSGSIIWEI